MPMVLPLAAAPMMLYMEACLTPLSYCRLLCCTLNRAICTLILNYLKDAYDFSEHAGVPVLCHQSELLFCEGDHHRVLKLLVRRVGSICTLRKHQLLLEGLVWLPPTAPFCRCQALQVALDVCQGCLCRRVHCVPACLACLSFIDSAGNQGPYS